MILLLRPLTIKLASSLIEISERKFLKKPIKNFFISPLQFFRLLNTISTNFKAGYEY